VPTYDERLSQAVGEHESPLAPGTTFWSLGPAITRADIPGLCEQLLMVLGDCEVAVVICDVGAVAEPDIATVEALARLHLTARQLGRRIQLQRAGRHLQQLLALTGLRDVLS
jgi:ABC-type transporter Mla MlaB component